MLMKVYKQRCKAQYNHLPVGFYGRAFAVTEHNNKHLQLTFAL